MTSHFFDLSGYTTADLMALRERVNEALGLDLSQVDMSQELLAQFKLTRAILEEAIADDEAPLNHITGVITAATTLLKELTKSQTELYNASRLQKLEAALVKTLKTLPKEAQERFFAEYEEELRA